MELIKIPENPSYREMKNIVDQVSKRMNTFTQCTISEYEENFASSFLFSNREARLSVRSLAQIISRIKKLES